MQKIFTIPPEQNPGAGNVSTPDDAPPLNNTQKPSWWQSLLNPLLGGFGTGLGIGVTGGGAIGNPLLQQQQMLMMQQQEQRRRQAQTIMLIIIVGIIIAVVFIATKKKA